MRRSTGEGRRPARPPSPSARPWPRAAPRTVRPHRPRRRPSPARIQIRELERALSVVGLEFDFPEELDVAPAVAAELAARPARRPLFRLRSLRLPVLRPPAVLRPAWQVVVAAVVAGLVAFSGVL